MAKKTETRPSTAAINPFGLRMQPELRERLESAASGSGRSMNAEIVARLERSFGINDLGISGDALDLAGFLALSLSRVLNEDTTAEQKQEIKALTSEVMKLMGSRLLIAKQGEHAFVTEPPNDQPSPKGER